MSTVNTIHTVNYGANIPFGYLDEDNIRFVQYKVREVLRREFAQDVKVDRHSIIRVMERALLDRVESIPKMNQRAIMMITNEIRNHQGEVYKHMKWENNYVHSQALHDPTAEVVKFDPQKIKLANRYGKPRAGGTLRFHFT